MQDNGQLPPISIIARSGRGVWCFWVLRADAGEGPVPAFHEKLDLYYRIQRALGNRLVHLEWDAAATDAARITRVPGSLHTGTSRRVAYWIPADARGQGYSYTLGELAEFLHVLPRQYHPKVKRELSADSAVKRKAWLARWQYVLRDFETLRSMRGGFSEGCRHHAALLYAFLLGVLGSREDEIRDQVAELAAECKPKLTRGEAEGAVQNRRNKGKLSYATISKWLGVTPDEATHLAKLRAASDIAIIPLSKMGQTERKKTRQSLISSIIARMGRVPRTREMAELLQRHGWEDASHVTISRDYKAIGVSKRKKRDEPELF